MNDPHAQAHPAGPALQPRTGMSPSSSPGQGNLPRQAPTQRMGLQPGPAGPGLRPPAAPIQPGHPPMQPAHPQGLPRQSAGTTINPAAIPRTAANDDAIELVEDADEATTRPGAVAAPVSKIKFGAELGIRKHDWKRKLEGTGGSACRVRTFHGKLSDQGLEYIDDAINVWLDEHPEVEVKFATTSVGMFDGKFKDLALIVNVWY